MGYAAFRGGIRPFDGKDMSKDKPVAEVLPKEELVFPLSQHIGAPARPLVAAGDSVLAGQILAEADGAISASVLCSVSGEVTGIEPRMLATGEKADCILVKNNGKYQTVSGYGVKRDFTQMSKDEIREAIKRAGIVGLGGAGFPTHVKLTPKNDEAIEYVIVNGAECEPYLTADYRVMLEEPERLVLGLLVLLRLFERATGVIAVEENKPDVIRVLQERTASLERIRICTLPSVYPQGAERPLIRQITRRTLKAGELPASAGCMVSNADTVLSVACAVCESVPLLKKTVTVTGDAVVSPGNYLVHLGTDCTQLLEAAGGLSCKPEKIIAGGPMMGLALTSVHIPVTKTLSGLLCMKKDPAAVNASACIRCGRCASVCPVRLVPQKMWQACERFDLDRYEQLYGMECCECGSCTYICPARIPLTQSFQQARRTQMKNRRRAQKQAAK